MMELSDPGYEASFPTLSHAEIQRLTPYGTQRGVAKGEVLFDQVDRNRSFFVVLEGHEIVSPEGESRITVCHRLQTLRKSPVSSRLIAFRASSYEN